MKFNYMKWNHLLDNSPWPFCTSLGMFGLLCSSVYSWNGGSFFSFFFSIVLLTFLSVLWWSDVMFESLSGHHNFMVMKGFRMGMMLFILSEMSFFFSFFWSYFHNVFSPGMELGSMWPPFGFSQMIIDPFSIPLLNTVLLLSSGVTVTWCHHSLMNSDNLSYFNSILITMFLGLMFMGLQMFEYIHSFLSFNSTVYGSTFFMLTGFHGLHVIVGLLMLMVCCIRGFFFHFSSFSSTGFMLASWYWHFVDVVWLFLYFFLYWYGGL